jgi:hypothetical protein
MSNKEIVIIYENFLYKIRKLPFETDENTYKRGWYIVKNIDKIVDYDELISKSIIYLNENKNKMKYV